MVRKFDVLRVLYWAQRPLTTREIVLGFAGRVDDNLIAQTSRVLSQLNNQGLVRVVERKMNYIRLFEITKWGINRYKYWLECEGKT